jgi:hypothetical protein
MLDVIKPTKTPSCYCSSCSRRVYPSKLGVGHSSRLATATCPCGTWLEIRVDRAGSNLFRARVLRSRASYGLKATAAVYSQPY